MRIGIELGQIRPAASGGIVQLLAGVLPPLFHLGREHNFFVYHTDDNSTLAGPPQEHVRLTELDSEAFWHELDRSLVRERIDVLFRPYPCDERIAFPSPRQVVLVPDLLHEAIPELFSPETLARRRRGIDLSIGNAGAVAVLAEHGRRVMLANHPEVHGDIFLLPPALPLEDRQAREPLTPAEKAELPAGPFFLFPANLWPHKNHRRLFEAFTLFRSRHPDSAVSIVLTGAPGGWEEMRASWPDLPIVHLGFIRPCLLAELYHRASALVYFSRHEGFGIPLLEAFAAGAPVLCSNATSLPDIGADAVLACDPDDVETMAGFMQRILTDQPLRKTLIERGRERLGQFNWQTPARNLLEACGRVAERQCGHAAVLDGHVALWQRIERLEEELRNRLDLIGRQDEWLKKSEQERIRLERALDQARVSIDLLQAALVQAQTPALLKFVQTVRKRLGA